MQGGYRGGIFYPNAVGRDDGVTLWGNLAGGLVQYRAMVGDRTDDAVRNPDDNPHLAGRLSVSLLAPETSWFNQGSYLGERDVLSVGGGVDRQRLALDGTQEDYVAWTLARPHRESRDSRQKPRGPHPDSPPATLLLAPDEELDKDEARDPADGAAPPGDTAAPSGDAAAPRGEGDPADSVVFNGVDAATGGYLVADVPVDQVARLALGQQLTAEYVARSTWSNV